VDESDKKLLNSAVGSVIRGERTKRGLSRQAFSEKSGIKYETLKAIETGKYKISVLDMAAAAEALGIPAPAFVQDVLDFYEDLRRTYEIEERNSLFKDITDAMSEGSTTSSTEKNGDPREMAAGELDQLRNSDVALAAHPKDAESEQDEQY
jgi:transcriptional regulator with XRE-family HTH domain